VDDFMSSFVIKLSGSGICKTATLRCADNRHLKPQTESQIWQLVRQGMPCSKNLTLKTTRPETLRATTTPWTSWSAERTSSSGVQRFRHQSI
jgi:hypothetical protein